MAGHTLTNATAAVLLEVLGERARQERRWGQQNHPNGTGPAAYLPGMFTNPFGYLRGIAQAQVDHAAHAGHLTFLEVLLEEVMEAAAEDGSAALRAELVQVAAVAVAWVEAIDRRTP